VNLGDIGLVRGSGLGGRLIRTVTRSPYAHAFLYVGDHAQGDLIEGDPHGVRYNHVSHYSEILWLTNLSAGLTDAQRTGIVAYATAHLGTPYSWIDDAEIGFTDVFGWAPRWMRDRLRSDHTLMCSQLCDLAYHVAGVELFKDGRPAGAVSPADLWRANR
jgi:hypothetical protein